MDVWCKSSAGNETWLAGNFLVNGCFQQATFDDPRVNWETRFNSKGSIFGVNESSNPQWFIIYRPRSSFVALFSGRLGCWLLFEISVRKSSSSPKRLLLQFTYDFPGFISCCITMLRIQPHSILCQLNSLMWAIDKTKWSNDKWPANRQGQPPPTLYPP